jgi:hypothetical protein
MTVRYERSGGRPPRDFELLEIGDDGSFRLWRTVGWERTGRFSGQLDKEDRRSLQDEVDAVTTANDLDISAPRDAAIEIVQASGRTASMGHHEEAPEPWRALVGHLRRLVNDLTSQPEAAVEFEVEPDASKVRLRQVGTEALRVDLSGLKLEGYLLDRDGVSHGHWLSSAATAPSGPATAEPGWIVEIPLDHQFDLSGGRRAQIWVAFDIFNNGGPRRARMIRATPPGQAAG